MAEEKCAKFLSTQRRNLDILGLDLNATQRRYFLKNPLRLFFFQSCSVYWIYGLMNFSIYNIETFDVSSGSLSLFNQGILIIFKLFILLAKASKFLYLMKIMNQLAKKAKNEEYDEWISENRTAELIAKVYSYICWVAISICAAISLIYSFCMSYNADELKLKLPLNGRFPFDENLTSFAFNYVTCVINITAMASLTCGTDSLYFWFIYNISAHFRILRKKLEVMAQNLTTNVEYAMQEDLGVIVNYHLDIIHFIKLLNEIFGEILFAEVTLSCLQMCFATHALMNDVDISNVPFNIMVVLAIMAQLMIYCFGGEKIRDESMSLHHDIYLLFPWHKMSPQERRLMLLPLLCAQGEASLIGLIFQVDRNLLVFFRATESSTARGKMCKFHNRLFIFAVYCFLVVVKGKPFEPNLKGSNDHFNELLALSLLTPKDDYDLHYDQRQKGNENYRLKLDGFFLALPQEDDSSLLLLTEDLLENLDEDLSFDKQKFPTNFTRSNGSTSDLNLNTRSVSKPEVVFVEMPGRKMENEARNNLESIDNDEDVTRPKSYLYRFLNILKRNRKI
uniref:Odorant receptor n=1 Tax=Glossina brevipalpis TaxID=37001 RepID=A0A1A9W6W6_9MUSC